MTSEVVIDVQQKDISIALMEDKQLVEYQNEPREASFSVGNIYIAKVKKLMPGATERNFSHSLKPASSQNWKRTEAFRMS